MRFFALPLLMLIFISPTVMAIDEDDYPYTVNAFTFDSQQQTLQMQYMDVKPAGEAKGVMLLLHGKNFTGAYWHKTIEYLTGLGYRVVVPDQVGFGSRVRVRDIDTDEEIEYVIVFGDFIDLDSNQISMASPIGRALLGKALGDVVVVNLPRGEVKYEIVELVTLPQMVKS